MDKLLAGPSAVLVASAEPAFRDAVAAAVERRSFQPPVTDERLAAAPAVDHHRAISARTADDADEARRVLGADERVGCVVADDSLDDVAAFVADVTEAFPDHRVVVAAADGDEALASAATRAGAFAYVPLENPEPDAAELERLLDDAERALRAHDRAFRRTARTEILDTMLDAVDIAMYAKDTEGRHLESADVAGSPDPVEAIGRTDVEVHDIERTLADDLRVVEEGAEIVRQEEYKQNSGDVRWYRTTKVPWRDPGGEIRGLVGVTEEITALKRRIRELEARNRRLDGFASFVTHDLREPLETATDAFEGVRDGGDQGEIERLGRALDRMTTLIDDLVDLAYSGRDATVRVGGVELGSLAREVWAGVETGDASLDVAVPDGAVLNANPVHLRPLFENLFRRAIEDAPDGVAVRVATLPDGFVVASEGLAVSPAERAAAFGDGDADESDAGLSIVAEVADAHGWDASVTDGDGETRFEFRGCMLVADPARPPVGRARYPVESATDVGQVSRAGGADYDPDGDAWSVRGAGRRIGGAADDFQFAHARVSGPVRVVARVALTDAPLAESTAGLLVRNGTAADAAHGYVGVTGDGRIETRWRPADGDEGAGQSLDPADREFAWLSVDRVGDRLTCFASTDGEEWLPVDQRTVALEDPLAVGLAVCSTVRREYATATFEDVAIRSLDAER